MLHALSFRHILCKLTLLVSLLYNLLNEVFNKALIKGKLRRKPLVYFKVILQLGSFEVGLHEVLK